MEGFDQIKPGELPALAKVCNEANDGNLEETLEDLECIDRLLTASKSRSLMLRKNGPKYIHMIDMIVHKRLNDGTRLQWNPLSQKMVYVKPVEGPVEIDFSHRKKK